MTTDGGIRASDHDRENAVEVLREAYAVGRLDLDEFDQRTTAAYSAKTWGDLRELTSDLPVGPKLGADLSAAAQEAPEPAVDAGVQYESRRPFVPVLPMALVWLAIAAAAHTSAAIIPLILLALFALRAAGGRRRPPDRRQQADPPTGPTT
ncbi:MAG TPA: DUF1707 domain-containing protein [Streptosporangiaceae bacterium]|jgi:hypothetical protein|nr:DUF1707 domain-containing protein [Streptosporangiaceae bacterium]